MESFQCRNCSAESGVKRLKVEAGHRYLVCEFCEAEHQLRLPAVPGGLVKLEIVDWRLPQKAHRA